MDQIKKILSKINNFLNKKQISLFIKALFFLYILFISYIYLENRGLKILFFGLLIFCSIILITQKYIFKKNKTLKIFPDIIKREISFTKIISLIYILLLFLTNTIFAATAVKTINLFTFLNIYLISSCFLGLLLLIELKSNKINISHFSIFSFVIYILSIVFLFLLNIEQAKFELNIILKISEFFIFHLSFLFILIIIGKKIINIFKIKSLNTNLQIFFSLGLGFAFLSLSIFLLAILGFLNKTAISIFIIISIALSYKEMLQIFKLHAKKIEINLKKQTLILLLIIVILSAFSFIVQIKPLPYDNDSLHSYFNTPWLYTNAGHYIGIQNTDHQGMGQNAEMIYTAVLALFNIPLITNFSIVWLILSLFIFYYIFKNFFSKNHVLFGLILFFLSPITMDISMGNKVDNLLLFFFGLIFLSLYYFYLEKKPIFLYLAGIFAGYAIGIKYTAFLFLVPFAIFTLLANYKQTKKYLIHYFLAILLSLLIFSPWAIKNIAYYNNPLHPYVFQEKNYFPELNNFKNFKENRKEELSLLKLNRDKEKNVFLNFFEMFWNQSLKTNSDMGFLSLLIIPFFFLIKPKKKNFLVIFFVFIFFIPWYLSSWVAPWYVYPGFILLYLIAPGLLRINKFIFLYSFFIYFAIFSLNINIFQINLDYLSGKTKTSEAIKKIGYQTTAEYINNLNLSKNEKIIIVGDFKLAFIKKNDEIVDFIDPYLQQSGYSLMQGEKFFVNFLKKRSIKYILYSTLPKRQFNYWLTDTTLEKYLESYESNIPSIYQSLENFENFLKTKTNKIFGNEAETYYALYELK
jgi:hypothetical protein